MKTEIEDLLNMNLMKDIKNKEIKGLSSPPLIDLRNDVCERMSLKEFSLEAEKQVLSYLTERESPTNLGFYRAIC